MVATVSLRLHSICEKTVRLDSKRIDWFTVSVGILVLVFAATLAWIQLDFYVRSTVTLGEVTKLNAGGYHPQVEFTTEKGERISFPGSSSYPVEVGDRLEVRYLPSDPRAQPKVNQSSNLLDFLPAVFGMVFVIAGLMGKSLLRFKTKDDELSNK